MDVALLENGSRNKIQSADLAIHNWYQFVLGYPPHLVRHYINQFGLAKNDIIFDPFSGSGTTPVESMKAGFHSIALEANPLAAFASTVKTYRYYNPEMLWNYLAFIYESLLLSYKQHAITEPTEELFSYKSDISPVTVDKVSPLSEEQYDIIPEGFISAKPYLKTLILKQIIQTIEDDAARNFFLLALASFIVKVAGNVGFGPEVYRTKPKDDIASIRSFTSIAETMINDVTKIRIEGYADIYEGDARSVDKYLPESLQSKINCVITSPPYPNEKDYTRSTRLESVLLDFIKNKNELRAIKENLLRSNSRNVFVSDKDGDQIESFSRIVGIAEEIERKRLALKKTSGFEKHYHRIVLHYFGGMYRHLQSLKPFLAKDAQLAYVVGDQMSFFQILIPTAELLGEIAESLGYEVTGIELWRTRIATATRMHINENVLLLKNE